MRIRDTDRRQRRYARLTDVTKSDSKSGALDEAADYYLKMAGGTTAQPTGLLEDLMTHAIDQGSLTPQEIAHILSTDEIPIEWTHDYTINNSE